MYTHIYAICKRQQRENSEYAPLMRKLVTANCKHNYMEAIASLCMAQTMLISHCSSYRHIYNKILLRFDIIR